MTAAPHEAQHVAEVAQGMERARWWQAITGLSTVGQVDQKTVANARCRVVVI
jgi:hypothetical protein